MLRYERHTIRQANLSSIEWRLPHVAATVRRRAIGPGSERRWPVFGRFRLLYIYGDAILNRPCLSERNGKIENGGKTGQRRSDPGPIALRRTVAAT